MPFARYADDLVVHCKSRYQAERSIERLGQRLDEIGLQLHPDKTKKVYVGKGKPREGEIREFTFLGYNFKRRVISRKDGVLFYRFYPGASKKAMKEMTKIIRSWRIHRSSGMTIEKIAGMYNAILRGWINYYGHFWYHHFAYQKWKTFQSRLIRWVKCRMSGDVHVRFCVRPGGKFPGPTRLADTPSGAHASALFYSLIEGAKAVDFDPSIYMSYLLYNAAKAITEDDWRELLPVNLKGKELTLS